MADTPYNKSSGLTTEDIFERRLASRITLLGSNVLTAINAYADIDDVIPYVVINGVQPVPADTGANFPALTSGANSSCGIVVYNQDGFANGLVDVQVPALSIQSLTMTAGIVDAYGAVSGLYNTGVTASNNLAFRVVCTGLNLGAAVSTSNFWIDLVYKYKNV